ncbi:MAG: FHA domain-containing protein [Pseudomonadota bacterium]
MAKLHFLLNGNSLGEFALDKERISIGRRPGNQIHIDNLAVSGEHAVIVTIGNDSFLEDLNSTNGTMVNGKAVKKYVLQHDDVIEFGKYQLKYINERQTDVTHHDGFEKTMMLMPSKPAQPISEKADEKASTKSDLVEESNLSHAEPNAAQDEKPVLDSTESSIKPPVTPAVGNSRNIARLQVLTGASAGRELMLNKTMTTLGKPGSQVAVINKRPNGYFITHVGGNSLPAVNGQTIGVQAHALNHGDIVELAGTKMEFFLD